MSKHSRIFGALARRFLLLSLTPIVLIGTTAAFQLSRAREASINDRNQLIAQAAAATVSEFLRFPERTLGHIGRIHRSDEIARDSHVLVAALEDFRYLESVAVIDQTGRVEHTALQKGIGARSNDIMGIDRSRDPQLLRARETGAVAWSGVFTSPVSGRRALEVAVPSHDFVIMATIDIESLVGVIDDQKVDQDVDVAILDSNGSLLFHSNAQLAAERPNWSNLDPVSAALRQRRGDFRFSRDDTHYIGSTALIPDAGWVVLAEQPEREAMQPVRAAEYGMTLIALLVGVVALVAAYHSARSFSRPIVEIETFARGIAEGAYEPWQRSYRYAELDSLSASIGATADAVAEREKSLTLALHDLEQANHMIGSMSAELSLTEDRERRRLAEELHDRVTQVLAVSVMQLSLAEHADDPAQSLVSAKDLVRQAVRESRALTTELYPPVLHELGLGPAILSVAERLEAEYGLDVRLKLEIDRLTLVDDAQVLLLRATQELLMNTVKHAHATHVRVTLSQQDGVVRLTVADDGVGMRVNATRGDKDGGFGLFSIRQRLIHLGGTLDISSEPGRGTSTTIRIPTTSPFSPTVDTP